MIILALLLGIQSCRSDEEKKDERKEDEKDRATERTDREKKGLKGQVVQVQQRKYEAKGSEEEPQKGDRVGPAFENFDLHFNSSGMKTMEAWYDSLEEMQRRVKIEYENGTEPKKRIVSKNGKEEKNRTIWEYNERGLPIKKTIKGADGGVKWEIHNKYDPEGRKIETIRKTPEGDTLQQTKIERNEKGWVTEERRFNAAGSLEQKTKYVRDKKGRVARKTNYDEGGTETGRFSFVYNEEGERTEIKKFDESGDLERWREYSYNDKGSLSKEVHKRGRDGEGTEFVHHYERDDQGNWTRRITLKNGELYRVTERELKYE